MISRGDAFVSSLHLLKPDYLTFYLEDTTDPDLTQRAEKATRSMINLLEMFEAIGSNDQIFKTNESVDKLENRIAVIFSEFEILVGMQDETYGLRLYLTELKVPELLVEIFVNMQENLGCDPGDELFLQGVKVLYQICKGNFAGQAQITTGSGWAKFRILLLGNFAVYSLLFLKQLFEEEEDFRFIHLNKEFAFDLLEILSEETSEFQKSFSFHNIDQSSADIVLLYTFQALIRLFLKTNDIQPNIKQNYDLVILSALHRIVNEVVIPLFRDNPIKIEDIYDPKLIKKSWKLEDGPFLISLMLLTGDHIKSMMTDLSLAILTVFNEASSNIIPGHIFDQTEQELPYDIKCFDYLFKLSEGIKFKQISSLLIPCTKYFPNLKNSMKDILPLNSVFSQAIPTKSTCQNLTLARYRN